MNIISSEKQAKVKELYKLWEDVFTSKGVLVLNKSSEIFFIEKVFDSGNFRMIDNPSTYEVPFLAFDFEKYVSMPYEGNKQDFINFLKTNWHDMQSAFQSNWILPEYEDLLNSTEKFKVISDVDFFDLFFRNPVRIINFLKAFNEGAISEDFILNYIESCRRTLENNLSKFKSIVLEFVELCCGSKALNEKIEEVGLQYAKELDGKIESVEIKPFFEFAKSYSNFLTENRYARTEYINAFAYQSCIRTAFIIKFKEEFKLTQQIKDDLANIYIEKIKNPAESIFKDEAMTADDFMTHIAQRFCLKQNVFRTNKERNEKDFKSNSSFMPIIFAIPKRSSYRIPSDFDKYIIMRNGSKSYGKNPFRVEAKVTDTIALVIPNLWSAIRKNPSSVSNFIPNMELEMEMF